MYNRYIKESDARNAIMDYIGEQTVSKYASSAECKAARDGAEGAMYAIEAVPTADVVPRSEVNKLEYTLLGVMHSVDKWLKGEELKQDEVNRAITMREKTLRIIENANSEVEVLMASEILKDAEIETLKNALKISKIAAAREIFDAIYEDCFDQFGYINYDALAELKKKYTEGG